MVWTSSRRVCPSGGCLTFEQGNCVRESDHLATARGGLFASTEAIAEISGLMK